jgi:hypothetical protein
LAHSQFLAVHAPRSHTHRSRPVAAVDTQHQQGTKVNSKGKEVAHGVRLYSIASSRYGDAFDGKTTTLCVRRAVYTDPETGKEDPAKKGLCSNFLCDATPGTEIMMTGAWAVLCCCALGGGGLRCVRCV